MAEIPFKSFLMGGFECSTHRIRSGRRLDMIAATRHDQFAEKDYTRLLNLGMGTARDGLRWHLIETEPYKYDLSSLEAQARAAALASELAGTQREIETRAAQSQKAADEAVQQKQAAETTVVELRQSLQQEQKKTTALIQEAKAAQATMTPTSNVLMYGVRHFG